MSLKNIKWIIRWFAFSKKLVVGANHQSFSHCSTGAPHLMLRAMMTKARMITMMVKTMMAKMMANMVETMTTKMMAKTVISITTGHTWGNLKWYWSTLSMHGYYYSLPVCLFCQDVWSCVKSSVEMREDNFFSFSCFFLYLYMLVFHICGWLSWLLVGFYVFFVFFSMVKCLLLTHLNNCQWFS